MVLLVVFYTIGNLKAISSAAREEEGVSKRKRMTEPQQTEERRNHKPSAAAGAVSPSFAAAFLVSLVAFCFRSLKIQSTEISLSISDFQMEAENRRCLSKKNGRWREGGGDREGRRRRG
uniref:Uncharacterized protein n=1 Tax=Nelumbo nucifera TaxID=4432 RepID=A0A822XKM6_NELNU|nr:TPA_asm: hypothetical protein HUJ06_021726 [Nelumbo nucifera]